MQEITPSFADNLPRIKPSELEDQLSKTNGNEPQPALILQLNGRDHSVIVPITLFNRIVGAVTDLTRPTSVAVEKLPKEIKEDILNNMPTDEEVEKNCWSGGRKTLS